MANLDLYYNKLHLIIQLLRNRAGLSCKSKKHTLSEAEMSNVKRKTEKISGRSRGHLVIFHLSLLTCLLLALSGCESFQPIQDNEEYTFSIYGYLDASADTQWVRVTPVREQLDQPPVKPEMEVTLEHMESGSTVVMNDSLFLSPDGFNYLNAWSETDIEPEQTYRLKAVSPDAPGGRGSSVTVTTPEDFPDPDLEGFRGGCSGDLRINGVERLADVKSVWHIRVFFSGRGDDRFFSIPYRSKAFEASPGSYSVYIDTIGELNEITSGMLFPPDSLKVIKRELFVASGGPEWNEEITSLDELIYYLPDQFSNVENGVGYVIGIVSKTIPLDHCL